MLKDDDDVRDLRNYTHKESDVRVSEYALHNDLVLNFCKELIG